MAALGNDNYVAWAGRDDAMKAVWPSLLVIAAGSSGPHQNKLQRTETPGGPIAQLRRPR